MEIITTSPNFNREMESFFREAILETFPIFHRATVSNLFTAKE